MEFLKEIIVVYGLQSLSLNLKRGIILLILSFNRNEILTVVVGAHNLTNKNERSVRIGVKSYHKHPDYCSNSHLNDIMLLRV